MANPLVDRFLGAGLLEFGLFGKAEIPFRLNLHLLPSYPKLLKHLADSAQGYLTGLVVDRLICPASSLPFGVTVSQQTGIPLVYSRGSDQPGVFDLVGAYDVGHPALLLTNIRDGGKEVPSLIGRACKVGLEVHSALAIVDYGQKAPSGLNVVALLSFADALEYLAQSGKLPQGQARAAHDWLGQRFG